MKKTIEPTLTSNITPLAAFNRAMHTDLKRVLQPLYALRTGWRNAGVSGAYRAFLRAQRNNFPLGLFSLLLLAQGLVFVVLLVAVVLDGFVARGGLQ